MTTNDYLDMEAGETGWEPIWVVKLHPIECDECDGGEVEFVVGEAQGMGGVEQVTRTRPCDEAHCYEGLLGCVENGCDETPAYEMPSLERLCVKHMKEAAAEIGAYSGAAP